MEKEGLHRAMEFISQQRVLVTDRHRQINKWIRENHPEVAHYYDIWHVAKGKQCIKVTATTKTSHMFIIIYRFP